MNSFLRFIWRTMIGGVLFLAPLLLMLVLAHHAIQLIGKLLHPVATHLPMKPVFGIAVSELLAGLLLLLIGFAAGLLAQTGAAAHVRQTVEQLILSKIPGYTLFKAVAEGAAGEQSNLKVALANIDDAWLMSFIVEEHASGLLTVFVPSAPTPTAGSIYYLTERQVKRVDVPVSAAVKCIMRLGVGSSALLEGKISANERGEVA